MTDHYNATYDDMAEWEAKWHDDGPGEEAGAPTAIDLLSTLMGGTLYHSLCSAGPAERFHTVGHYTDPVRLLAAADTEDFRGADVWFGVHGMATPPVEGRGGASYVTEVRCLVADLDWADDAHKTPGLLSEDEARAALASFDHAPTHTVDTGHGLHCYWLLDAPTDPATGAELTARLHAGLAHLGLKPECGDLTSVLRVPGTLNHKRVPHAEVVVTETSDRHYTPERLDRYLQSAGAASGGARGAWRPVDRGALHPADRTMLEALEDQGWHDPILSAGKVQVYRPGKAVGTTGASIGYTAPGLFRVFTSDAAPYVKGRTYDIDAVLAIGAGAPSADEESDGDPLASMRAPDGYHLTGTGNASRLVDIGKGHIRFVLAWKKWIVYEDGRWFIDIGEVLVTEVAKGVARSLRRQVPDFKGAEEARNRFIGDAIRSEETASLAAMIRAARGIPAVRADHEDLDTHGRLLNVLNGEIDLETGELLPHDPDHLFTKQAPVAYDPEATCPLFMRCLERWQPEKAMQDYLQLEAGAGAIGFPYETLSIHIGPGNNGKGKFWGAIQAILGPYAVIVHKSLLVTERHEQHQTEKAKLFRARLGTSDETGAGDSLNEEQVKGLTGGDRLSARKMQEDPWEFDPTHTLVLKTNELPKIKGRNEAIWRRVRKVTWDVIIPEKERDADLATKLAAEYPGILNWIIEGARRCLAEGFTAPEPVRLATADYRGKEDTVGQFVDECLVFGTGSVTSERLKAAAAAWCEAVGLPTPLALQDLTPELERRGCRSERRTIDRKKQTVWYGVMFSVDDEEESAGETRRDLL